MAAATCRIAALVRSPGRSASAASSSASSTAMFHALSAGSERMIRHTTPPSPKGPPPPVPPARSHEAPPPPHLHSAAADSCRGHMAGAFVIVGPVAARAAGGLERLSKLAKAVPLQVRVKPHQSPMVKGELVNGHALPELPHPHLNPTGTVSGGKAHVRQLRARDRREREQTARNPDPHHLRREPQELLLALAQPRDEVSADAARVARRTP